MKGIGQSEPLPLMSGQCTEGYGVNFLVRCVFLNKPQTPWGGKRGEGTERPVSVGVKFVVDATLRTETHSPSMSSP